MAGRQLLAQLGQEDIVLSGDPEITFFQEAYPSQARFASRVISVSFEDVPTFGDEVHTNIPLIGDLMTAMYLSFNFPINIQSTFQPLAGILMVNFVEIYSGSQLIERIWGEYLGLLNECQVPSAKQIPLTNILGEGTPGTTFVPAVYPFKFTVPLPFQCLKRGLPVVPDLNFRVSLNESTEFTSPPLDSIPSMEFKYLVEYVVLTEPERNFIKKRGPVIYLGESVERAVFGVPPINPSVRCVTQFLHPVKELFFTIRNRDAIGLDFWYDYSNATSATNTWANNYFNINHLNSMAIYFEGVQRIDPTWATSVYLGTTQFIDYHTRVPTRPFYMYSFALDPENHDPTGSVNMGRIKNQYFDFFLKPTTKDRVITIWARYQTFLQVDGFKSIKNLFDNNGDDGYLMNINYYAPQLPPNLHNPGADNLNTSESEQIITIVNIGGQGGIQWSWTRLPAGMTASSQTSAALELTVAQGTAFQLTSINVTAINQYGSASTGPFIVGAAVAAPVVSNPGNQILFTQQPSGAPFSNSFTIPNTGGGGVTWAYPTLPSTTVSVTQTDSGITFTVQWYAQFSEVDFYVNATNGVGSSNTGNFKFGAVYTSPVFSTYPLYFNTDSGPASNTVFLSFGACVTWSWAGLPPGTTVTSQTDAGFTVTVAQGTQFLSAILGLTATNILGTYGPYNISAYAD